MPISTNNLQVCKSFSTVKVAKKLVVCISTLQCTAQETVGMSLVNLSYGLLTAERRTTPYKRVEKWKMRGSLLAVALNGSTRCGATDYAVHVQYLATGLD